MRLWSGTILRKRGRRSKSKRRQRTSRRQRPTRILHRRSKPRAWRELMHQERRRSGGSLANYKRKDGGLRKRSTRSVLPFSRSRATPVEKRGLNRDRGECTGSPFDFRPAKLVDRSGLGIGADLFPAPKAVAHWRHGM